MAENLGRIINDAHERIRLKRGTKVRKVSGYSFPGVVVSVFQTTQGKTRFVVEATGDEYAGMLHIFNADQLEQVDDR